MDEASLERIRAIRKQEGLVLRPTQYLRQKYVDEFGEESPVKVRNYQAQGIMNLLQVARMILGDDTGLGKTLQLLNVIGYVWMKEPEYVPVVLTKKSALHQWAGEAGKFMQQMEVCTVDGEPYERHAAYEDFFLGHDPARKRLIIMTYDSFLRDCTASVIRDRGTKPDPAARRGLKDARALLAKASTRFEEGKRAFEAHFGGRDQSVLDYARLRLIKEPGAKDPDRHPAWSEKDEALLVGLMEVRDVFAQVKRTAENFADLVAPPKRVPGIMEYLGEMMTSHPGSKILLVMDEMHVLKNHKGKLHQAVAGVAAGSHRAYGMTATAVKNRLMEFWSLFRIIQPTLFPTVSRFHGEFCVTKLQKLGGGRHVPVVVGYRNLDEFVRRIEPYYLTRRKHEVAKELPKLITRELVCEMTPLQEELYDMAEVASDEDPDSYSSVLTAMVRMQQAVDAPSLLEDQDGKPYVGESPKIDTLVEMLQDELDGVKTIVFSVYERMISLVEQELIKRKIKCVRITGKEAQAAKREKSRVSFQTPGSGVNVILITLAGAESINLHAAEHFVALDSPWSWGDYIQLVGRMVRIGSLHDMVVMTHLIARRCGGGKVIDDYVIKKLRSKKALADKVAGVAVKDGLKFAEGDVMELYKMIREARIGKTPAKAALKPSTKAAQKKEPAKAKGLPGPQETGGELVRTSSMDPSDF